MSLIKIPNYAFYSDSVKKLCPDELLVFMFLFKYRSVDDEILMSINILNKVFKFQKGNDRKNRPYIKNILLSLENKEYLKTNIESIIEADDLIKGSIINSENGYCGVESKVYDELFSENDLLEAKLKLYLYSYIHCYGDVGRKVQYSKLSSICNYFNSTKSHSVSTVQKMIDEMDGKYIFRFSGERDNGEVVQGVNTYFTEVSFEKLQEYYRLQELKANTKKKTRRNSEIIQTISYGDITVGRLKEIANEETNWQKTNLDGSFKDIDDHDYEIYRTCVDENVDVRFIRRCRKGIETMKQDPERYNYDWDLMESIYLKNKETVLGN